MGKFASLGQQLDARQTAVSTRKSLTAIAELQQQQQRTNELLEQLLLEIKKGR